MYLTQEKLQLIGYELAVLPLISTAAVEITNPYQLI